MPAPALTGAATGAAPARVGALTGVGVVGDVDENSSLRPGQQVATMMGGMGRSYDGTYAQYVTVPAAQVIPFETGLRGRSSVRCRRCSRPPTDR